MSDTLTVVQLNERVRSLLNNDGVRDVWVMGEISNMTKHSSGHYYFTLKDGGSEIRCSLFKGSRARIGFEPNENMKVLVFGRVDIYVQRGQYQFIVDTMRASGIGDLYLQFEELKKKLEKEGLFETSRKRDLPKYPRTVGIVTSPTGAVIHDILTVSERRFPADILFYPAIVQGNDAPASIVRGIELMNRENVDVIIVGRGGGSLEDLWAFNTEEVARSIVSSKIPVISAVGHETDVTIADMVADRRAATPSEAAELAFPDRNAELKKIAMADHRLSRSLMNILDSMENRFKILDVRLSPKRAEDMVNLLGRNLNDIMGRADMSLKELMNALRQRTDIADARLAPQRARGMVDQYIFKTDDLSNSMDSAMLRVLSDKGKEIRSMDQRLVGLNPTSVLGRGYSIIKDSEGRTISSVSDIAVGTDVDMILKDGRAKAEVKKVMKNG